MKKQIKVRIKTECNCEDHHLELLTSFDGTTFVYKGFCYKCGKSWTYTKNITTGYGELNNNAEPSFGKEYIKYVNNYFDCAYVNTTNMVDGQLICNNSTGDVYVYRMCNDGTVGELIKIVRY